jgi:hypothetical protein
MGHRRGRVIRRQRMPSDQLGRYDKITTPVVDVLQSRSVSWKGSWPSLNSRRPLPSTIG